MKSLTTGLLGKSLLLVCIHAVLLLLSHFSHVWLCATHRRQPTRLPRPWDFPGKNTGVGCHVLLCIKVKSESEMAHSCPTLRDPTDCSLPDSSVHGVFRARGQEWGAIAFTIDWVDEGKRWSWFEPHPQVSRRNEIQDPGGMVGYGPEQEPVWFMSHMEKPSSSWCWNQKSIPPMQETNTALRNVMAIKHQQIYLEKTLKVKQKLKIEIPIKNMIKV